MRWIEEKKDTTPKNRSGGGGVGGVGVDDGGGGSKDEVARSGLKKRNIGKEGVGWGDDVDEVMR